MICIRKFGESNAGKWDRFITTANNGTLFHLRRFINYHPEDRFNDHSIEFYKKDNLFVVFPAADVLSNGKRLLISHPGTTMGSFVVPENLSLADALTLVEKLIIYARGNDFDRIRITLPPAFYQRRLSNYIDFSLFRNGFSYFKREVTSTLFLERNLDQNSQKFRPSHRRALRKAQNKGIEIRRSERIAEFYAILKENLKIRHGVEPTHTLAELEKLQELFPDKINLFGAFLDGRMIAGVVNFIVNSRVVLAFYISHKEEFQDFRAVNLLFYLVFKWAIQESFKVYDFGIFTVNEEPNMGLGRFKENFGASGVFRDTLEIQLR